MLRFEREAGTWRRLVGSCSETVAVIQQVMLI